VPQISTSAYAICAAHLSLSIPLDLSCVYLSVCPSFSSSSGFYTHVNQSPAASRCIDMQFPPDAIASSRHGASEQHSRLDLRGARAPLVSYIVSVYMYTCTCACAGARAPIAIAREQVGSPCAPKTCALCCCAASSSPREAGHLSMIPRVRGRARSFQHAARAPAASSQRIVWSNQKMHVQKGQRNSK
jgi:hypothetical protein